MKEVGLKDYTVGTKGLTMSELVGTNSFIELGTNGLAKAAAFSDLV